MHCEHILWCTICKLQLWWSHDNPLAIPSAMLTLSGNFNLTTSLSTRGCNHLESLPFDMYAYAKSLSFPSMQNPSRETMFLCLYLRRIIISGRNCLLNWWESNSSLLTAMNWPLGSLPWYIIPIFPTPMALSIAKQSVASRSSSNLIVEVNLSNSTEICVDKPQLSIFVMTCKALFEFKSPAFSLWISYLFSFALYSYFYHIYL